MDYRVASLAERPDLLEPVLELHAVGWPEFLQHDPAAERYEPRLAGDLADFQVLLLDGKDELAAVGVSIAFTWGGAVGHGGARSARPGSEPAGAGGDAAHLSRCRAGGAGRSRAAGRQERLPLTSMERYVRWAGPDGAPFDYWLRTHLRLGATILAVCPASIVVQAGSPPRRPGRGCPFPRPAATSCPTPWSRSTSIVSATSAATSSRTSGSATPSPRSAPAVNRRADLPNYWM